MFSPDKPQRLGCMNSHISQELHPSWRDTGPSCTYNSHILSEDTSFKKTLEWQLELSTSVIVSQHSEDAYFVTILAFNRLDTCTVRMELVE